MGRMGLVFLSAAFGAAAAEAWRSYEVYEPSVERFFVNDPRTQALQYNHDSSIAWYGGRWICLWNANEPAAEGRPGQLNYMSSSRDGRAWSAPVACFSDPRFCEPPVPCSAGTQWQPNLIVVGPELWALWCQHSRDGHRGAYLSRLREPDGRWENTRILFDQEPDPLLDGRPFRVFPTQNPIRLRSGRVLAPVTLSSSDRAEDAPADLSSWWAREKRNSVIHTDDLGLTWHCSPGTIQPGRSWAQWEPTVWEAADGSIRMFARNNDFRGRQAEGPRPAQMLLWSRSMDGGATWTPHEYVPVETVASRMHVLSLAGNRFVMVHNDWPAGRFVQDRRNLALFFNRGGGMDFVAGPSITGAEPFVMYPQMWVHEDRLLVSYSQGNALRSIKVAHVAPLPDPGRHYLFPRGAGDPLPRPAPTGKGSRFEGGQWATARAAVDPGRTCVTLGAWVCPEEDGALFDNRAARPAGGFLVGLSGGRPFLYLGTQDHNISPSRLRIRAGTWTYVGVSIEAQAGWVDFVVSGESERVPFHAPPPNPLAGVPPRIGYPALEGSRVPGYRGELGVLFLCAESLLGAAEHGAVADATSPLTGPGVRPQSRWPGALPELLFDPGEQAAVEEGFALGAVPQSGGSAAAAVVEDTPVLRIRGEGSAGVELDPNRRDGGDEVDIRFRFRIENGDRHVICTLGDADEPARLTTGEGRLRLESGHGRADAGPIRPGQWTDVALRSSRSRTSVGVGDGAVVAVEHRPKATWVYLGQGYRGGAVALDSSFLVDTGSVRTRVIPATVAQPRDN